MKRSVSLTPDNAPRFTIGIDNAGDLKIWQEGQSIVIGGDWVVADLFNAIHFVIGHKTK